MNTDIALQLDARPGVHLRVVSALKRLGLRTADLKIRLLADGGKRLELEVESDGPVSGERVAEQLGAVEGVVSVLSVGELVLTPDEPGVNTPDHPPEAAPARDLTEAEKRFKNFDSEAGDAEIRDRMLVFSLLSRYPNLAARLIELRSSIPAEDLEQRFYEIGHSFGKQLAANIKPRTPPAQVSDAIQSVVLPAIGPLARVSAVDALLKIDMYDKKFDRGKPHPVYCIFMQGTIDGLLRATPGIPLCRAYKTKCVHTQDVICEFNIVAG